MILYKYLPPSRISVIGSPEFRFTPPADFNDPFDMRPFFSALMSEEKIDKYLLNNEEPIAREVINENLEKLPPSLRTPELKKLLELELSKNKEALRQNVIKLSEELAPRFGKTLDSTIDKTVGAFCLTEDPTNLMMWSHYAENHTGFIIGFDTTHPFFHQRKHENDPMRHLRKVRYTRKRPAIKIADIGDSEFMFTKGEEWRYEKEWRILLPLERASKILKNENTEVHLFSIPLETMREVIIGCKASNSNRKKILSAAKELASIRTYQSEASKTEYGITLVPAT